MSDLKFADTHNLVAFLEKPTESEGFEEIIDFLNANPIKYALTVNPTIYCSCVKQFWDTVKAKTVKGEVQLQALVDKKKVIITESTIRRDLQLEDANGVDCLPNAAIFEQLTLMGSGIVMPIDLHHTPIIQPSISQPQKQKSRKSKKKNTEVPQPSGSNDNVPDKNIPSTSNDPLLSGEDRLKLTELMDLCTYLQKKVLNLEKAKTAQDSKIASLKKKVKKLERRNMLRNQRLKRLRKVSSARRVESFDEASLGDQEDASKQGRKIADIDADAEASKFKVTKTFFGQAFKRVNTFVDYKTELVDGSEKRADDSTKRASIELEQEVAKKQKIDDDKVDDDQEEARMKELINIVPDEEEVVIDAIPLATKPPCIVDWNIIKEGKINQFHIIRADGSSKRFEDMHVYMLVEKRYPLTPATIADMLNKKLKSDYWNEMCYQLLKLMTKQLKKQ
ncbi:hypothetical protein Tco_1345950 [Tanacetum coccineum]